MKRLVGALLVFLTAAPIFAEQPQFRTLGEWTAERRRQLTAATIEQSNTASKQLEAPAAAGASTSLVDQSSAADLVGLALGFAGLETGDGEPAKPTTVTATAYALLASIHGFDPLDPVNYNRYTRWRRLAFTLGSVDNPAPEAEEGEETADAGSTRVYGLKYTTNDRNPTRAASFTKLEEAVRAVAFDEALLQRRIEAYTLRRPHFVKAFLARSGTVISDADLEAWLANPVDARGVLVAVIPSALDTNKIAFISFYFGGTQAFERFQQNLLPEDATALDELVRESMQSFAQASELAQKVIDEVQNVPQFAFVATLKQPDTKDADDTFVGEFVFDKGVFTRTTLSANAAYEWTEKGADAHSDILWRFSAQLRYQLSKPLSTRPSFLDFATEGKFKPGDDDIYKTQAKLTLPLGMGVAMPISVTYANREELIEESDVRGEIGFTIDFSQLTAAFLRR